ncbi:hypothetical protein BJ508DRAFT_417726 [Ascobolus immersus RN42]|uniref:Uncharacterized protein n=1 Tax=Ascobolus immersus RN42 TaxID=1160509 RepID=A0A3N4HSV2_ASCIM|nr:hypothetical protein BJ508DRAFT_417726 [Ascobolus immersus RN42]
MVKLEGHELEAKGAKDLTAKESKKLRRKLRRKLKAKEQKRRQSPPISATPPTSGGKRPLDSAEEDVIENLRISTRRKIAAEMSQMTEGEWDPEKAQKIESRIEEIKRFHDKCLATLKELKAK